MAATSTDKVPALSVASAPHQRSGALLAVVTADGHEPAPGIRQLVQQLWDIISLQLSGYAAQAHPVPLAGNRIAAQERARVIAELTDAHAAALSALLGALRSRTLDDAAARRTAVDIAVGARATPTSASSARRSCPRRPAP